MSTLPLPTSAMLDAIGYQRGSLPETAAVSGERRSALRQWARLCGLWPNGKTPDGDLMHRGVDWREIAEAFRE